MVGLSLDFAVINFAGFLCLSVYYTAFAWNAAVRAKYRYVALQDIALPGVGRASDIVFAQICL